MKKRLLSTLLALCVALALVPAAGAAGLEDYQYFEFTNDPVGCYQITVSGHVFPAVWVFPDGTKLTITIPDGGSITYLEKDFFDDLMWEMGFGTVDGFGPVPDYTWQPEIQYGVGIWSVYASEDPISWEPLEGGGSMQVITEDSLEEIYVCKQSTLDAWVAAGVATVTDPGTQPTTPAEPEQPTAPAAVKAVLSLQGLKVDGKDIECEKYNIADRNYFKLRDLAQLLSGTGSQFEVGYDEATQTVSITTGQAYTPNGTELLAGVDNSATAQTSRQAILVNGEKNEKLTVYNIGGSNFFQLRELGEILGFEVDYDQATNTAIVNSK